VLDVFWGVLSAVIAHMLVDACSENRTSCVRSSVSKAGRQQQVSQNMCVEIRAEQKTMLHNNFFA
jgi:hypothetical protein